MNHSSAVRQKVEKRARGLCEYCLSPARISPQPFSVEHIIPKSKGGDDRMDNLALACQGCNNYKYNKTEALDPLTQTKVPRKDAWGQHFAWSKDLLQLVGLTAKGRATIATLQLNNERVVNLRRILLLVGEHQSVI